MATHEKHQVVDSGKPGLPRDAQSILVCFGIGLLIFFFVGLWKFFNNGWPSFFLLLVVTVASVIVWRYPFHHRHHHEIDQEKRHTDLLERSMTLTEQLTAQGFSASMKLADGREWSWTSPLCVPQGALTIKDVNMGQVQAQQLLTAGQVHIPTFAESLASGEIGPGQRTVLLCYELGRDEAEDQLTGKMEAYRDQLENASTLFLGGGSKSGKSTLITHIAAQMAIMGALFYIIDPHLMHPEKSIAKRLEPLAHAFILPPVMTDADVYTVLQHAKQEASARECGKETRLSGRPIVFIADEILNLFGRAQRSTSPEVQHLYRDLALFMRDLGTQYNKFGMNGIFASQYVTKDAFKLPGANIDFRDGCQSQGLLRLPANQAQAMRLIQSSELRGMRTLPVGHGYMGFYNGDVIRMAFGNVTRADIEQIGRMIERSGYSSGTHPVHSGTRFTPSVPPVFAPGEDDASFYAQETAPSTGTLQNARYAPVEPPVLDTAEYPMSTDAGQNARYAPVEPMVHSTESTESTGRIKKEFTPEQELQFVRLYEQTPNMRECLRVMRLSYGDYQASASQLARKQRGNQQS